jgi:hypothetical protein
VRRNVKKPSGGMSTHRAVLRVAEPDRSAAGSAEESRVMQNIVPSWETTPRPCLISLAGTTGQTLVIPGVGGTGLPLDMGDVAGLVA